MGSVRLKSLIAAALVALPGIIIVPGDATAQDFTGLYSLADFPGYLHFGCDPEAAGMDGGPVLISDTRFVLVDTWCDVTNPVPVREMDAVLYDATCFVSGYADPIERRIFLARLVNDEVVAVFDGGTLNLEACSPE